MHRKTTHLACIAIATALSIPVATAEEKAGSLPAEILACAEEEDVIRRLSCYDREVAALRAPANPAALVPRSRENPRPVADPVAPETAPPAAETPAAPVAAVLARSADVAPAAHASTTESNRSPASGQATDDFGIDRSPQQIVADVVEIGERPYGELIIRLDNGQVWEQKHLDRRFRLEVGQTVTIKRGAVSGYRLSGTSNRSIQVQRIQ